MISETKLDLLDSFIFMAFLNLKGLIEMVTVVEYFFLYIREDTTSKLILAKMTIEEFFVEINLRKKGGSFTAHITKKTFGIGAFEQNWQIS